MTEKIDEAPVTLDMKKLMQTHARHDAWKNKGGQKQPEPTLTKKDPSEFDPKNFQNTGPKSDLKLAGESGVVTGDISGIQAPMSDEQRMTAIRELIRNKIREVVRKKAGGGGYVLYAPNKGKKGKARGVGTFPTKLGAKRAELARFPPNDPAKLKRLRREVDRLGKDPKKAAEREKNAQKQKGTDKGFAPKPKKESLVRESPFSPGGSTPTSGTTSSVPTSSAGAPPSKIAKDPRSFMSGLQAIPKDKQNQRVSYVQSHLADPSFVGMIKKQQNGDQIIKQLYGIANNSAKMTPGSTKTTALGAQESVIRRNDFMERRVISTIMKKSLNESMFREEKAESEWDEYISRLSKKALSGDGKFQNLQKNINKKTEGILSDAFEMIRKAVGKNVKLKSFGVKHDAAQGMTYLAFSASFEDVTAEPLYIHIEGGVPKIELSQTAKVSLTKADPDKAKLFRAELVTVQERVLDEMDDLSKAISNRDKYLAKLEGNVDSYVAGLSALEVSLLKNLLVKKYRRTS